MPINVTDGLAGFEEVRFRTGAEGSVTASPRAICSCCPAAAPARGALVLTPRPAHSFIHSFIAAPSSRVQSVRALENDAIFQQAQDDALHQLYYNVSQKASAELGLA